MGHCRRTRVQTASMLNVFLLSAAPEFHSNDNWLLGIWGVTQNITSKTLQKCNINMEQGSAKTLGTFRLGRCLFRSTSNCDLSRPDNNF